VEWDNHFGCPNLWWRLSIKLWKRDNRLKSLSHLLSRLEPLHTVVVMDSGVSNFRKDAISP
jgi:hypothetical protein